jgi:hypothetical protein
MRLALFSLLALSACATLADAQPSPLQRAETWSAHVAALSADDMEGRAAGTPGHQRAADYVVAELRRLGLRPAGTDGFFQQVPLSERRVDHAASSARLSVGGAAATPVALPQAAIVAAGASLPETVDAPLVFIGYGLHAPASGHDDLAGIDLRGKIAVFIGGSPPQLPGAQRAHARAQRSRFLAERGAVGAITLIAPGQLALPWAQVASGAAEPAMILGGGGGQPGERPFLNMVWNPAEAQRLFAGQTRTFAELAAAADASASLPGFDMNARLAGRFASVTLRSLSSPNVIALLPGSDPALASEHIVLTAHLDGLGVNAAGDGDRINNGALDNAAGVAALLDIADLLRRQRPRRSILFAFVTAEERGLLGSTYFARNPTVPRQSIAANLNYDMALPLFPLRSVLVLGAEESSIGDSARAVAAATGIPLSPDPFPDRNSFIRSDQYSFIQEGIPAVAFKFGFAAGSAEAEADRAFRAERYHRPSDDLTTKIFSQDEIRLHDFIVGIALQIANAPQRPRWNSDSIFRR